MFPKTHGTQQLALHIQSDKPLGLIYPQPNEKGHSSRPVRLKVYRITTEVPTRRRVVNYIIRPMNPTTHQTHQCTDGLVKCTLTSPFSISVSKMYFNISVSLSMCCLKSHNPFQICNKSKYENENKTQLFRGLLDWLLLWPIHPYTNILDSWMVYCAT